MYPYIEVVNEYNNPISLICMFPSLFPTNYMFLKCHPKGESFYSSKLMRYLINLDDEYHGFS